MSLKLVFKSWFLFESDLKTWCEWFVFIKVMRAMNDLFFQVHYIVRDIKSPNNQSWFPQFFPWIFLRFSSWKRKQTFYWSKTVFFSVLDQWNVSTAQTEKKFGETRLVIGDLISRTRYVVEFFFWKFLYINLRGHSITT